MNSSPAGFLASLRGFATTSVGLVRTRLELLKVETQEEVGRIAGMLLWGVSAVLLAVVGLAFLAIFVTVLFWDSHRLLALAIFSVFFIGAAGVAISMTLRLARQGSQLFSASLAELRSDAAALSAAQQTQDKSL